MDSVSGVQEFLVLINSGTKRTAINAIVFKNCFYKQRIKLPQLQCIFFRVAAGVGGIVSCCMGTCYAFSWVGGWSRRC